MVLTQRHPNAHGLAQALAQVQPIRIFGLSGTIALNLAALMLLLAPSSPPMQVVKDDVIDVVPIDRPKPPTPPPPIRVDRLPKPDRTTSLPIQPQVPQPPLQQNEVIVPDGNTYTPPVDPLPPAVIDPPPTGSLPSASLQYAFAPAPTYPREALMDGIEGTVLLKVLVDVDGSPLSVDIERSSGNRKLDEAARRQVLRKWKFKPALRDGLAIQVYGMVPVSFSLSLQ